MLYGDLCVFLSQIGCTDSLITLKELLGGKMVSSGDEDNVFLQSSVAHLFKQFRGAIAHVRIYKKKTF